jgi:ParB/RepB/Spo0J family partition protein
MNMTIESTAENYKAPHFGYIPITCVVPSKTNPRKTFDEKGLEELAKSIKEHGVAQPILVRPLPTTSDSIDAVEIVAGERRYRASIMAEMETIPAIMRNLSDAEVMELQVIENLQREGVSDYEEAEGYGKLIQQLGYKKDDIAKKIGKSRSYVYGRLKLLELAPAARSILADHSIPSSTALLIARIPIETLQEKAAKEIIGNPEHQQPMSYRAAVKHIQARYMLDLNSAPFPLSDNKLLPAASSCMKCPKRAGNQSEIFEGIDANVCTDPDCYSAKRTAHNEKVLAQAEKKGIPIYSPQEARELLTDDLSTGDSYLYNFERPDVDSSTRCKSVDDLLKPEQLPKPKGYIKAADGKPVPIFEKTAVQEALEKAGLCHTLDAHNKLIAEKLAQPEDPAAAEKRRAEDAKRQARIDRQSTETAVRVSAYRQIRASIMGGPNTEALRILVRDMSTEYGIPNEHLPEVYPWSNYSRDEAEDFIAKAEHHQLLMMMFDMNFRSSLEANQWSFDDEGNLDLEDSDYKSLSNLAGVCGIDIDAIRAVAHKVVEPDPEPSTEPSSEQAMTEPPPGAEPAPAPKAKKKTSKKSEADSVGTVESRPDDADPGIQIDDGKRLPSPASDKIEDPAEWPFPTSAGK